MRILVLAPAAALPGLAAPLTDLGHTVGTVRSDRGRTAADMPLSWTRGHWYTALRSLRPHAVITTDGDEDAALILRTAQRPRGLDPEEHVIPVYLLGPGDLLELFSVLFPPEGPGEASEAVSGAHTQSVGAAEHSGSVTVEEVQDAHAYAQALSSVPSDEAAEHTRHATEPAPRRTRKRALEDAAEG